MNLKFGIHIKIEIQNAPECRKNKGTRLYRIWENMKARCNNANSTSYCYYGEKGIKVCEDWNTFFVFKNWALKNGYSEDLTLDRIDVNGNYEPNNCRWVTHNVQARNKRNNVIIKINNEEMRLKDCCKKYKISYKNIHKKARNKNLTIQEYLNREISNLEKNA